MTVFDNSPRQLDRDREVAIREGLELMTIQGDMRDLSIFQSECFDLIFHPVGNCFVDNVLPIWHESARTLRHGGVLLSGFYNPVLFSFDFDLRFRQGIYKMRHPLPYADLDNDSAQERDSTFGSNAPLKWSLYVSEWPAAALTRCRDEQQVSVRASTQIGLRSGFPLFL